MIEQLTFQRHPLKSEIVERWDKKQSNKQIHLWLVAEHPEVALSIATLCKHFKRYKFNKDRLESTDTKKADKALKKKKQLPVEQILWETIQQCRKMKKEKTISVKDWQYLDQQLQSAVEKLIRIQGSTGEQKDISVILAEIFSKIETEGEADLDDVSKEDIGEEKKLLIIKEVDDENKTKQESDT